MGMFEGIKGGKGTLPLLQSREYYGGEGGPPSMEARVAVLEKSVGHIENDITEIKSDLRKLLGALIAGFLLLAGLMAHGFKWF